MPSVERNPEVVPQRHITPESAMLTVHDLKVESSKAKRDLGYIETNLDTLLNDTIAWLRAEKMIS